MKKLCFFGGVALAALAIGLSYQSGNAVLAQDGAAPIESATPTTTPAPEGDQSAPADKPTDEENQAEKPVEEDAPEQPVSSDEGEPAPADNPSPAPVGGRTRELPIADRGEMRNGAPAQQEDEKPEEDAQPIERGELRDGSDKLPTERGELNDAEGDHPKMTERGELRPADKPNEVTERGELNDADPAPVPIERGELRNGAPQPPAHDESLRGTVRGQERAPTFGCDPDGEMRRTPSGKLERVTGFGATIGNSVGDRPVSSDELELMRRLRAKMRR